MARRKGKRSAALFYIFTEGEVTEEQYFKGNTFGESPRADRKFPFVNKGNRQGTDPKNMRKWVEDTLSRIPIEKSDFVWIVIDKDNNSPEELRTLNDWCNREGYRLALSNPLFEYWFAIHFDYIDSAYNKEKTYSHLSRCLGCEYDKKDDYKKELSNRTDDAIRNAKTLRKNINEGYCTHIPFTNVDQLIEDIREFMRKG